MFHSLWLCATITHGVIGGSISPFAECHRGSANSSDRPYTDIGLMHARTQTEVHVCVYTYMHTYIHHTHTYIHSLYHTQTYTYIHFFDWGGGGAMVCLCPPLLSPHFYFPLELYVYITLTNNVLSFNYLVDNFNKLTQMAVSK